MTYLNTPTYPERDPPGFLVGEGEHEVPCLERCLQKQGDDILTPQQIYNRLRHCQRITKALLRTLEPYDNLSTPLCRLIAQVIGEEIYCINLARRYQNNRDMSRRVRQLENLLESYDDLFCHQARHDEKRIIDDAQKIARRWCSRPPSMQDDFSSWSSGDSITDYSFDDQERPIEIEALTKSQLVAYLEELVCVEDEVWRDMEDAQRSQPAQPGGNIFNPSQFDNSHIKKQSNIRMNLLLLQAERAASFEALDHRSRKSNTSTATSTREVSPCTRLEGALRRTSSLPEPADMSNRHAMLQWLKTSTPQQQQQPEQQQEQRHTSGESDWTKESPHQEHKTTTTPPEEQQEKREKKQGLNEAVEKLRKLGHGEIRIPEPATHEDRRPAGGREHAKNDGGDDDDQEEDNAVLRELKIARQQRWGSADSGGGLSSTLGTDSGSGS
ncbi:hypothetical protein F4810DRAFT_240416 [Camillea tinctor]|nr:hypothetical protein F4810DRAFT_240416 [Camillea tinctor]